MKTFPLLYSRNSNGSVQQWQMEVLGDSYRQIYGKLGGKLVTSAYTFAESKNIGKANESSPTEQAALEAQAIYDKKLKSNYFVDIKDIDTGFLEPQLAKPCKDYIDKVDWAAEPIIDEKLNGVSCIITSKGAFSRTNEQFHSIPHIIEALAPIFADHKDCYIQGEIFNPAFVNDLGRITELVSVVRQPKDVTPELLEESKKLVQYHIYEVYNYSGIDIKSSGIVRRIGLGDMLRKYKPKHCFEVHWTRVTSFEAMKTFAEKYIAAGGEGVIIRNPKAPYQHKRTKDLLKWKKSESAEYEVIELEEGTADWAGCAKAAWVKVPDGKKEKKSKVNVKGEREHLRDVFNRRHEWVGKMITVEYQELSPDNIMLTPYSDLLVRDYE